MRERPQGYVYVGGYQPHPDVLYIKAGKTNRPKDRVRDYGGMVPGGLTFMRAAKVESSHRAETQLLTAIAAIEGLEAIGGEWFRCNPFQRSLVIDKLYEIGSEVVQVHTYCPAPFGSATAGKRGINRRRRRG